MTNNKIKLTTQNNNTTGTIKGRIFIVPNRKEKLSNYFDSFKRDAMDTFPSISEEDTLVQVWVTDMPLEDGSNYGRENLFNGNESNWSAGYEHDSEKDFAFMGLKPGIFINYIPAKWLEGKKEGDVLNITIYDEEAVNELAQYELICMQNKSRYSASGNFEEVFKKVTI